MTAGRGIRVTTSGGVVDRALPCTLRLVVRATTPRTVNEGTFVAVLSLRS